MAKPHALVFFFLVSFFPAFAIAASLSFSPSSGSYSLGSTFSIPVYVGSADQPMNAASGVISFPTDILEVVSVSKTGSIFSLWAEEPSFSNKAGTASFEGIVLNPGFTGSSGKLLTLTFKAKSSGQAQLNFSSGSVLANDGTGTNILTGSGSASIFIAANDLQPDIEIIKAKAVEVSAEPSLAISSSTHTDESAWYSNNTPEFSWSLPNGALEVRVLIGTLPKSSPTVSYKPPVSSKKTDKLSDGIYYFHLQARTPSGWGEVSHYRVQIDTAPPDAFAINFPEGSAGTSPQAKVSFLSTDKLSGISHFEVKVGAGAFQKVSQPDAAAGYLLPAQDPGTYTVLVRAVDKAGNFTTESADFTVTAIESPQFDRFPSDISADESLLVRGTTYPDSSVNLFLSDKKGETVSEIAKSDSQGNFSLIWPSKVAPGTYYLKAQAVDSNGAKSTLVGPVVITVTPMALIKVGTLIITYFTLSILGIISLSLIIALIWYILHKFSRFRSSVRRRTVEAESEMHEAFHNFKDEVRNHLQKLNKAKAKRVLTREESSILSSLDKQLDAVEKTVTRKLDSLNK